MKMRGPACSQYSCDGQYAFTFWFHIELVSKRARQIVNHDCYSVCYDFDPWLLKQESTAG